MCIPDVYSKGVYSEGFRLLGLWRLSQGILYYCVISMTASLVGLILVIMCIYIAICDLVV